MKKILAVILALTMLLLAVPTFAESTEEDIDLTALLNMFGSQLEETGEEGGDLSALLNMFGGLGSEEGSEESGDLSALLNMFGSLGSEEGSEESGGLSALLNMFGGLGEESGEDGGDLSALLNMFGGLGGEEITKEGGEEDEGGLSELLAMLSGLLGEEGAQDETKTHEDAVPAESIEQFFGSWKLVKATVLGKEVPLSEVGGEEKDLILIINENGIFVNQVDEEKVELALVDGMLTIGGSDFMIIHLTADGLCLSLAGLMDLDFVAAE